MTEGTVAKCTGHGFASDDRAEISLISRSVVNDFHIYVFIYVLRTKVGDTEEAKVHLAFV